MAEKESAEVVEEIVVAGGLGAALGVVEGSEEAGSFLEGEVVSSRLVFAIFPDTGGFEAMRGVVGGGEKGRAETGIVGCCAWSVVRGEAEEAGEGKKGWTGSVGVLLVGAESAGSG
jgi:hypothetical protein